MGRDWFSYHEIYFCRTQMMWLILNIVELGKGNWPDNPDGSSYVDPAITSKSFRDEAYFVKASGLAGEVKTRLKKVGKDGQTLKEEISSGLCDYNLLSSVAKSALNYISIYDWRKRKISYIDWKKSKKYYQKVRKARLDN